ncbi:MAG: hypothetical protein HQL56_17575 [Magnetococcales bacterium]|nr:hypothetical protein [Magnetococcales bacterium]
MIHLLLSADYELYLGANHLPEEEVLLHPSRELLRLCNRLAVPLTLFADVACFWRYREWGEEAFVTACEAQMVEFLGGGHDIQAHLHPHWLTTERSEAGFCFPPGDYLLAPQALDETEARERARLLLRHAKTYLETLLRPIDPTYRCLAFRAGGYGVQPHVGPLFQALREEGYRIDSSIIPGFTLREATHRVDFSRVPQGGHGWFGAEGGLECTLAPGRGLFEIPIASARLEAEEARRLQWPLALEQAWRIVAPLRARTVRGRSCHTPPTGTTPGPGRLKQAWWRANAILGNRFLRLEVNTSARLLTACLNHHVRQWRQPGQELFLAVNMHPKGMERWHFDQLARFVAQARRDHGDRLDFLTFQQAEKRLPPEATP